MARLFGTDGVRGIANSELTVELAVDIGRAAVYVLTKGTVKKARVLIGKDTRISSDMLESALAAGICSAGADVEILGFIPTPAVAYLIKKYKADAGIVISASHNPMEYNGIKIFGSSGYKLADEIEDEIEEYIKNKESINPGTRAEIGSVSFSVNAVNDYADYICGFVDAPISGVKVAVDCANGASYDVARRVLERLGADAVFTAVTPDGRNINDNVGSTHLESIKELTVSSKADIGIAFDGDADRCIAVDESGEEIDGDKIIGIFAKNLIAEGKLSKNTAVVTVMTNLGFEDFCNRYGIKVIRTAVGDRYVLEEMLRGGYILGGEQSGHIIQLNRSTTGDGLLTAVTLLKILERSKLKASELFKEITNYPQVLKSIPASPDQKILFATDNDIGRYINELQQEYDGKCRILVRVSGTEPIIRVMTEGKDQEQIEMLTRSICETLSNMLSRI